MTYTEHDVERIVLEVIRRLGLLGSPQPVAFTGGNELTVTDRVVTMRSVEGKLAGVVRLVVPHRAVVTPAVRDELNDRQIELVRKS
ncbi:MAG: hypothetical protein L0211_26900 [Planctomycetaceae bacterium]|nr:hypothetical protein [Planctomycetaceae bacterium]